jgi:regulator of sigma E protease
MSILIFLAVLFVLVLVHEWGHYITAKWTGMRVDEFGIGFPPKLFGVKKGETEYTFNALPLGGFVKIYGEDGVSTPSSPVASEASDRRSEASAEAGEGGEDTVKDYSRSFVGKNKWAQALVLVAGVSMNVLFAWFLFSGAFMWGIDRAVDESEASADARLIVTDVLTDGPASDAELPRGVVITAVSRGEETLPNLTPNAFSEFVSRDASSPVQIAYTKGDELFMANILPEAGVIEADAERPAIGVALTLVDTVSYPIFAAVKEGFFHTINSTVAITVGLGSLIKDAVLGEADFSQVAGPVGIVGLVGEASAFGFSALLMFTAFISLNLAVINLLPFPALDGGRLLFVGIEAITRRPMPVRATQIMNTVGFFILIALMVVVTWNDISKLI